MILNSNKCFGKFLAAFKIEYEKKNNKNKTIRNQYWNSLIDFFIE